MSKNSTQNHPMGLTKRQIDKLEAALRDPHLINNPMRQKIIDILEQDACEKAAVIVQEIEDEYDI